MRSTLLLKIDSSDSFSDIEKCVQFVFDTPRAMWREIKRLQVGGDGTSYRDTYFCREATTGGEERNGALHV